MIHLEEDRPATHNEAIKEYGTNAGSERPEQPWILTPWDVWVKNPAYNGPPVPHPEYNDAEALASAGFDPDTDYCEDGCYDY